jgi:hypothetical protein
MCSSLANPQGTESQQTGLTWASWCVPLRFCLQGLVLEEGTYAKGPEGRLYKVRSADGTVVSALGNGVWTDNAPVQARHPRAVSSTDTFPPIPVDVSSLVVPPGCTIVVPTEASVRELVGQELYKGFLEAKDIADAPFTEDRLHHVLVGKALWLELALC